MSTTPGAKSRSTTPTVFEQQRAELVREIAVGMEQVLQNMNRLNRNLESIISVGNEFGSVEALWSRFENFMSRPAEEPEASDRRKEEGQAEGQSELPDEEMKNAEA
ncbi:DASH complex subunit DAD1 [Aspergillus saccharolyticus JOP 1030-1]|uniref:DASH complex subunit DAD1 n=1 Tax=Aspergillus saccharolyticus JOP 1030-1 TaxID=1450539 RepID=A0A319ATP9_9EURO|nr:hypothetical protein BP01DRAFT_419737 [Aspergillus saccharolyticus JOP 1030-1]PYH49572.1 hypothetical protein BP01DRAFT_419737 [Aspergillus saccharolyticus JOP 1030-1]